MIEKAKLKRNIQKTAKGDFSRFMTQDDRKGVVKLLEYAAKKANQDQLRLVKAAKK